MNGYCAAFVPVIINFLRELILCKVSIPRCVINGLSDKFSVESVVEFLKRRPILSQDQSSRSLLFDKLSSCKDSNIDKLSNASYLSLISDKRYKKILFNNRLNILYLKWWLTRGIDGNELISLVVLIRELWTFCTPKIWRIFK